LTYSFRALKSTAFADRQRGRIMSYKRYWWALAIVIVCSFAVLGGVGRKIISQAPPLPDVYTTEGQLLFTGSSITDGQGVWQSIGGQEIGTVWGHGAYVAPDWSADWLHRESVLILDTWAVRQGAPDFRGAGPRIIRTCLGRD
jgi:nitric oxide reductase subunit B